MAGYKHVLLAADLTDDTLRIGERAVAIARRYKAKLSLIHVIPERDVGANLEAAASEEGAPLIPHETKFELEALVKRRKDELGRLAERLGAAAAERWVVVSNSVAKQLRHIAQEQQVDLMVVGSHGRHGFALLSGSTSDAVLHGTPCDVLAVRVQS